jgi:hypothetical protein
MSAAALALLLAVPAAAPAPGFRAGAFARDVTPEHFPVSVNGGFQDRQATAATDRLHARCLVLADGRTKVALAVVDSCMIPRELIDEAKRRASARTGIPAGHILVSATHTHTAPTVAGIFQSEPDERYVALLTQRIADGIARADANLAPAEAGWGVAEEPGELFNRRWWMKPGVLNRDPFGRTTDLVKMNPGVLNPGLVAPAGPVDPDVSVLAVRAVDGRPLALYANYGLHYVGDSPPLSADYFGRFCERVGGLVGATAGDPPFVGLLSNGTSGDVNNVNVRAASPATARPGERCRAVAETVARAAKTAHDAARFTADVPLAVAEAEVELGVRKPTPADIDRANAILAKAAKGPLKTPEEVYARETVLLARYPATVKLRLQAMRVGGLAVVGIPCEVFAEIGLEIKRRSPVRPTVVVSLANGYNGYLPTPHHHHLGGYETWRARSSYLEVKASDVITAKVLELLDQVAR